MPTDRQPDPDGTGHPGLRRTPRVLAGLGLLALAALILWQQRVVRYAEADVAGRWFGLLLSGHVQTVHDSVYFPWENGPLVGLRDTWECTVALLASPLCAIGGLLLTFSRLSWPRLLIGLVAALVAVVAVNQLRLVMIAFSLQHWGWSGYEVSHKVVGSLFALAGFAVSLVLLFKIASKQPRAGND